MTLYVRVKDDMGDTGSGTGATESDFKSFDTNFIYRAGVIYQDTDDFQVLQRNTPDMGVKVLAGSCYVLNDAYAPNGNEIRLWEVNSTADESGSNLDIAANGSGQPRVDLICVRVNTAATPDDDASNVASLIVVQGTPGAGVPATPADHLKLAEVAVASGAASITNANITDRRLKAWPDLSRSILPNNASFVVLDSSGNEVSAFKIDNNNQVVVTSPGHIVLDPAASKLVKLAVLRQDNTTDTYKKKSIILTGWGFIKNDGSATSTKAVTFGLTFDAVPIVVMNTIGEKSGSDPTHAGDFGDPALTDAIDTTCGAFAVTTTGFGAEARRSTASSAIRTGFGWIAIGEYTAT